MLRGRRVWWTGIPAEHKVEFKRVSQTLVALRSGPRNPEQFRLMDSNRIDSAATRERPLAQPGLALSRKLKPSGERNPRFPSVEFMAPSGLPASPLGPSNQVPAAAAALPEHPGLGPGCQPLPVLHLKTQKNKTKSQNRKREIILIKKYKRALS